MSDFIMKSFFPHFIFLLLVTGYFSKAQNEVFKSLDEWISDGYAILDSASGNLNHDSNTDLILILKKTNEEMEPASNRPLLLLCGNPSGKFSLLAVNDRVVLCKECGGMMGDPYQRITIDKGSFTVMHYGGSAWRWTREITFAYDKKSGEYLLEKDEGESFHAAETTPPEKIIYQSAGEHIPFSKYSYVSSTDK